MYVIGGVGNAGATVSSATKSMWSLNVMKLRSSNGSDGSDGSDGNTGVLLTVEEQISEKWRKEADLPTLRYAITAGVVANQIIVAGGMRGFLASHLDPDPLKTVDVYDPTTKKWKFNEATNAPMHLPNGRHSPACVVVPSTLLLKNGKSVQGVTTSMLMIAGGYGTRGDLQTSVGLVEGDSGAWVELPKLKVARMGLKMSYSSGGGGMGGKGAGCVYAMGGMTLSAAHHDIKGSPSPITGVVEELCEGGPVMDKAEL